MAKRSTTEDHLALLRRLRDSSDETHVVAELQRLLAQPRLHGIVIKGAAVLAERFSAKNLTEPFYAAIKDLMREPKRDPGCEGKTAALKPLVEWDAPLPELFVQAAAYHQLEPVFGGSKDTAADFRGLAAIGLAATSPPGALDMLVDLLVDPEHVTRARAAVALGRWRGVEAAPLLRLKARLGDDNAEVIGETLASLLQIDGPGQLQLVAGFLHSKLPGVVESAAIALGQSKLEGALAALIEVWPGVRGSAIASSLLMAVSLLRSEPAVDWLLARLAEARPKEGMAILDALALFRSDARTVARIEKTAAHNEEFAAAFRELFGRS